MVIKKGSVGKLTEVGSSKHRLCKVSCRQNSTGGRTESSGERLEADRSKRGGFSDALEGQEHEL